MKKTIIVLMTLAAMTINTKAQSQITIVDQPALGVNNNYPGFRSPLNGGYLIKLPVGQVQPRGWLREYLVRQSKGLNGELGTVSAWLDKNNNQWLSNSGDHGWEEVPYWLRGYASLAYILDDEAMKNEAKTWFEAVLKNQKADGFLGPKNSSNGRPEVWAQMIMLWALQTYYEHSGDERVLTAMAKYLKWELTVPDEQFLEDYWENKRASDNEWTAIWLYNHTGDAELLPVIEKLHQNSCNWEMKGDLPNWHGVNVAQGFREPATYYVYSGNEDDLAAAYDNHNEIRRRYGQVPGGMYGADENARRGYADPRQGAETCALVEQMASDEIMMSITGDTQWADHCEDVALNTFTAALTPDMRALRYITSPNMAISDGKKHGPSIDNDLRGMLSMSPFSSRCCQHNHGMGWPYYSENLIMATADNGLATMLYAANQTTAKVADGKTVTIEETTNYPFDEAINLTIHTDGDVAFPLYLRIPAWAKDATVTINGEESSTKAEAGRYVCINRTWKNGDTVGLTLPMTLTSRRWTANNNSISFNYGPLTLSLKITERYNQRDSRDHEIVQDDSHWQEGVDASLWPAYEIFADSPWNYAIVTHEADNQYDCEYPAGFSITKREWPADNFPFTLESVPFTFTAKGKKVPTWGFDVSGMTDVLPSIFAPRDETTDDIELVPMGAARLRISAFPTEVSPLIPDCEE